MNAMHKDSVVARAARLQIMKGSPASLIILGAALLLLVGLFAQPSATRGFVSSEVQFADASAGGLLIMPASCMSSPPDPHTPGECDTTGSLGISCTASFTPAGGPPNTLTTYSWSSVNASWYTTSLWAGNFPPNGTIPGAQTGQTLIVVGKAHGVWGGQATCIAKFTVCAAGQAWDGTACINNLQPPTNLTGQCTLSGPNASASMDWTPSLGASGYYVRVNDLATPWAPTTCGTNGMDPNGDICTGIINGVPPFNFTAQAGHSYTGWVHAADAGGGYTAAPSVSFSCGACTPSYQCVGNTLHDNNGCAADNVCTYGCSANACNVVAPASIDFRVVPLLVQSGTATQVIWENPQYLTSCTVTGSNGNTWSSLTSAAATCTKGSQSGCMSTPITQQTNFTIVCNKTSGGTITQSATVNIIPFFCETGGASCP